MFLQLFLNLVENLALVGLQLQLFWIDATTWQNDDAILYKIEAKFLPPFSLFYHVNSDSEIDNRKRGMECVCYYFAIA